ncbi:type VI secretion system tip protein VgrG [candidate division KSB1 bacterium]|nr:type VI secretion system tip protein VgrG [candidate division KSB1 bacterium]
MLHYKSNQPLYKLHFSELDDNAVKVLSFEGEESISRLFEYRFDLISSDPELDAKSILNKKATFEITRGEDEPLKIHGIISRFEQRGRTPDYVSYYAVLVPKLWRLTLNFSSNVFQKMDIEQLVSTVLKEAGLASSDFEFQLNESYPKLDYCVQYRETDFNFINRRLEHYGIFYYFDHREDNEVLVITDSTDNLKAVAQEEDIFYNPNRDPLSTSETVTELVCQEKVVTGKFKLKDYNYEHPTADLSADNQIDSEAPGLFYDYGDHFKDKSEGNMLVKVRNEEAYSASKVFRGRGDCRLFHAGFKYKLGKHYREDWNSEFVLTRVRARGSQGAMFAIFAGVSKNVPTYENVFESIPADMPYRPPRLTPIPRIPGIMTARLESGAGDEYAFIDDHGRYRMKVPFDLTDKTNGEASRTIRLSQPYSGPGYGFHFPNHADTEIVWACVDGNVDRPIGLGTVPNPNNTSPSTGNNKAQSVIRTAGQNELTLDDTTGSENIYLHGTKDWTIDIVNDKNQRIGNNESTNIGNNQTLSVGANRDKTVGASQTESVSANKTITVGGNHSETITGNMTQNVGANKNENIAIVKSLAIGAAYQVSVGAAMNETVGAAKAEEIGAAKSVNVGANSSENVGANKSVSAAGNISESAGKDFSMQAGKDLSANAGKKMSLSSGDDFAISGGKKGVITIKDELTIKVGKATITLKKNGDISINGKKINIKGSGDIVIKGKKVLQN